MSLYEQFVQSLTKLVFIQKIELNITNSQQFNGLQSSMVFKNMSQLLNILDLSLSIGYFNNFQFDESFILLFQNLSQLKFLQLKIKSQNSIKLNMQIFGQAISNLINLEMLNINLSYDIIFDSLDSIQLAQSLKNFQKLKTLNLTVGDFNFQNASSDIIMSSIKYLTSLTKLNIDICSYNKFEEGFLRFAECFENLSNLQKLQIKIGAFNQLGNSITVFSRLLEKLKSLKCLVFSIDTQDINDQEANSILRFDNFLEGLLDHPKLQKLIITIESENDLGTKGLISLGKALATLTKLEFLDIYVGQNNKIQPDDSKIFCGLLQSLTNLKNFRFNIEGPQLQQGIKELGKSLYQFQFLQKLELNISFANQINWVGAKALAYGLQNLQNLIQLDLVIQDLNLIGKLGMKFIGQALQQLCLLKKFTFFIGENNLICNESLQFFGDGLKYLKQLVIFHIAIKIKNPIIYSQNIGIEEQISCLQSLEQIFLDIPVHVANLDLIHLSKGLKMLINLKYLNLSFLKSYLDDKFNQQCVGLANNLSNCKYLQVLDFKNLISDKNTQQFKKKLPRLVKI
ncbi:hypothetical protein ABPG74_018235 [Tetrahymena malaccensis]